MKATTIYFSTIFFITTILSSCSSDYTKNLGDDYFYRFEASDLRDIHCERANGGQIPADVVAYDFDDNFIIAKQKPKLPQDPLYGKDYKYSKGGKEFYYWLIVKKSDVVLGPLSFEAFNNSRIKYKVPRNIMLN
jgi:adenine/guanine phosphoribosyltransferase-like PRPP-binding protein